MAILDIHEQPMKATDAQAVRRIRQPRLVNPRTGMGGGGDRGLGTSFIPVRMSRSQAETLYQMSWAAARLVDIPIDDMFAGGRMWTGEDKSANAAMEQAEAELFYWEALPGAMKAARIFGSGMIIVCPADGDFESPLRPDEVKEGGLANLVAVDRWSLSVQNWQTDPTKPRYGRPFQYRWSGRIFGSPEPYAGSSTPSNVNQQTTSSNQLVNADRCIRFDGVKSPLTEGWTSGPWEREWGVSILTRALDDLLRDADMSAAAGQLVGEASIWVQKIQGFRETLARGIPESGDVSIDVLAEESNALRSIWRTLFIDSEDEADRLDVTWSGLTDVLNRQSHRLAAIGGVPITRFHGSSATGLSATGDGDARDWRISIEALRGRDVDPPLNRVLDVMIARHAGLDGPPKSEWGSLGEMTEAEKAEITKLRTEAAMLPYTAGVVDEDETRERLSQDEWWGPLNDWTPREADEITADREMEKMKMLQQQEQKKFDLQGGGKK